MTRRALLSGVSTGMAAGAAAWIAPAIFIAKPAAGATLSGSQPFPTGGSDVSTSPSTTGGSGGTGSTGGGGGTTSPATSPGSALAFTGVDIQRDAEIGAALIAGGWAMHHWASRTPKLATETATVTEEHEAGSQGNPT
jgi:hypothetical protein